jgi:hypothetical protein
METLKFDFIQLNKALKTLDTALKMRITLAQEEEWVSIIDDCTIKRFSYTQATFSRFLKRYKKVACPPISRELYSPANRSLFSEMAESGNVIYNSCETPRAVLSEIPRYYAAMMAVVERIGKNIPELEI